MKIENIEKFQLPGLWIDHPDRDWAFLVKMFLDEILNQLNEAHLVLVLFDDTSGLYSRVNDHAKRLHLIYAKSFVYALDAVGQLIRVLHNQEKLSTSASNHCKEFLVQFDGLRDLRNSLQHIEDRLRGLGRNGKPIPNHLLVLGGFRNNDYFGATTAEGRYIEIKLSNSIILQAYSIIEDLIWCFDWLGPGNIRIERPSPNDQQNA